MQELVYNIGNQRIERGKLFLIAGPCVLENSNIGYEIACELKEITRKLDIPLIFKASYAKANRTSKKSYRGPGLQQGIEQMCRIKQELGIPVLSDVHSHDEVEPAAQILDVLQIPAFLCRQTHLIEKAAETGKAINIKKGQFMAPWDMKYAVEKVVESGNNQVFVTERGASFGYGNLVVDMRSFPIMSEFKCLVVFDGTHSNQLPGAGKGETAGNRAMVAPLVKAAVAVGCDGLFLEVHPQPEKSPSDRETIYPLAELPSLLEEVLAIRHALKKQ